MNQPGILVVEDHDPDFESLQIAMRENGISNPVWRCVTGDETISFLTQRLSQEAGAESGELPGLILLDLNLPGFDGREVLQSVKSHDRLRLIPIVVLSTSNDARDVASSYKLGANSFIHKPATYEALLTTVRCLKEYWLKCVLKPVVR